MENLSQLLTNLRAAIAVVAARERTLTALLVLVWGRVSRAAARWTRLVALWRAGKLPKARASRAGTSHATGVRVRLPTAPGWLAAEVWEARGIASQLAHLLTDAELAAFLAAVPQARRIMRPICRMLGVGVRTPRVRAPQPAQTQAPRVVCGTPAPARPEARPGGLVLEPGGRFLWA